MTQIMLARDLQFAPCAFLLVRRNAMGVFDHRDEANTILVQADWDYPRIAAAFGWRGLCNCGATDGTVDCEHKTAGAMIVEASEWLCDNAGALADDPGYF